MTREEMFKKGNEARKQEKEAKTNKNRGFKEIPYVPLIKDSERVVRIVGNPLAVRNKPTDPKLIGFSYVINDMGKTIPCIWPSTFVDGRGFMIDNQWILFRLVSKVLEYTWDTVSNIRIYKHKDNFSNLFIRVNKNNKPQVSYEKGMWPKKMIVMNVIDRQNYQWHKDNLSYKVLSSKVNYKDDKAYYSTGVPESCYASIWDDVVEYHGDWELYDVAIRKTASDPFYKAFHCPTEHDKINEGVRKYIKDGVLTEEEKSWTLLDLDKEFAPTPYRVLKAQFSQLFIDTDNAFHTHFYDELISLVERESGSSVNNEDVHSYDEEDTNDEDGFVSVSNSEGNVDSEVEEVEANQEEVVFSERPKRETIFDVNSLDGNKYKGIQFLSEENKALIIGVNEDGSLQYAKNHPDGTEVQLYRSEGPNGEHYVSPGSFSHCPYTGVAF